MLAERIHASRKDKEESMYAKMGKSLCMPRQLEREKVEFCGQVFLNMVFN